MSKRGRENETAKTYEVRWPRNSCSLRPSEAGAESLVSTDKDMSTLGMDHDHGGAVGAAGEIA